MVRSFLTPHKKSATYALKRASKRVIQKTAEATGDLVRNKIAEKATKKTPKYQIKSKIPTQLEETLAPVEIPKNKYTYHQKSNKKLLMNFIYFKIIYRENLLGNTNSEIQNRKLD